MWKLVGRGIGAAIVAAVVLVPRVTIADDVSDEDRRGEWDDGGQRFGSIVIRGDLVAAANAPGGWALVRTYENTGDARAHCQVEERILRTEALFGARVTPPPRAVLTRTQTLDLGPHEKRSIGIYLTPELGADITAGVKIQQAIEAQEQAGKYPSNLIDRVYAEFSVDYLRPLAPGETRLPPDASGPQHPERMMMMGAPSPPVPAKDDPLTVGTL